MYGFFFKGGVKNVKCVNLSESIQQVTNTCHQWGGDWVSGSQWCKAV